MQDQTDNMKVHSDSRRAFPENDKGVAVAPESVPMNLLNEEQAQINHSLSLDALNNWRCGMTVLEILDNIHRRKSNPFKQETWVDVHELNAHIRNKQKYPFNSFSDKEGWLEFYNFLREERKFGSFNFQISFHDGVHFSVESMEKSSETLNLVLTHQDTI